MYSLISHLVALWLTTITHYHTQTAVQLINSPLVNTTEDISKQAVSFFVLGCDYKLFTLLSPLLIMFVRTKLKPVTNARSINLSNIYGLLTQGSSCLMSPGVCVLSLTHFGTPKFCSLGLHIEVEQGYMWPTAGFFTCDGILPAAQTRVLTKSISRCVLTS